MHRHDCQQVLCYVNDEGPDDALSANASPAHHRLLRVRALQACDHQLHVIQFRHTP
jgi:hypothetical protein